MYISRSCKGGHIRTLNILVYAANRDALWKYRDLCINVVENLDVKLNLNLTMSFNTVCAVTGFTEGGIDLFISDLPVLPKVRKMLRERREVELPVACCVYHTKNGYVHEMEVLGKPMKKEVFKEDVFRARLQSIVCSINMVNVGYSSDE
mgnify:FL=1